MIILKSMQDLENVLQDIFKSKYDIGTSYDLSQYVAYNKGDKNQIFSTILPSSQKVLDMNKVADFAQVVFQLNDYKYVLKNFVEILLATHSYEQLCAFLNKFFVPNVGDYKYRSVQKEYSLEERYFDRFVEIIKYCNIQQDLFFPFFMKILKADASSLCINYKEPLKEYLKIYLKSTQDDLFKYGNFNDSLDGIEYFLQADTNRTIKFIIDSYVDGKNNFLTEIKKLIIKYKQEALNILEAYVNSTNPEISFRAINLLLTFKGEWNIDGYLANIYKTTQITKVKNLIARELELEQFTKFESYSAFIEYVNSTTPSVQERVYGARLKKYYQKYNLNKNNQEGKIITFCMETFKSLTNDNLLKFVKDYFCYVDEITQNKLARVVYETSCYKNKLNSKWALRLIACFADDKLLNVMTNELENWYKLKNYKSSEYFLSMLALSGRHEVVGIVKHLLKIVEQKQQKMLYKLLEIYVTIKQANLQEVYDELTDDFGLDEKGQRVFELNNKRQLKVVVNSNAKIEIYNNITNKVARCSDKVCSGEINIKQYLKALEKQIKICNKRLNNAFLEFRNYSKESFEKLILNHNLLKIVAGNMLWGKYRNNRLYESFKVVEGEMQHISGTYLLKEDDYTIALVHPLDIVDDMEVVKSLVGNLNINQLDIPTFNQEEYSPNAISVDSLSGIFSNARLFISRLQKLTYKINNLSKNFFYNTLAKANKDINLLTVVEFDDVKLNEEQNYTTTISHIRFYNLNQVAKDGKNYLLDKAMPLPISAINFRIFSNEIALIYMACSND